MVNWEGTTTIEAEGVVNQILVTSFSFLLYKYRPFCGIATLYTNNSIS